MTTKVVVWTPRRPMVEKLLPKRKAKFDDFILFLKCSETVVL